MKLSVVLLEYHSIEEIQLAVQTIRVFDSECEIVVSSNSLYNLEEKSKILDTIPSVKWVFNDENGGFGYGMNMGAKEAVGEYIVFLNSDVIIKSDFNQLIDYLEEHDNVGIIGPELTDSHGVVQDSYRKNVTPFNFFWRHVKRLLKVKHEYKKYEPEIVDWVIGAFMLTKRSYFELVGGFDSKTYFMYVEDMDLCNELKRKGLCTVYYPLVSAQYVGTRAARKSLKYAKIFLQSLFGYWRKNFLRFD